MAIAAFPYTSFSGTILSSQVMANYNHIRDHYNSNAVETSGAQTIAGVKTFSSAPVLSVGATITAGGLTVTAGNVTLTAGNLTFGAASAKVIPGATSLLFRDNGDANTNLSITDAGAVTIRAGLTVSGSGIAVTGNSTITGTLGGVTTLSADAYATTAASLKLLSGATSLLVRNNADGATLLTISNAGAITHAGSAAFTFGGGSVASIATTGANLDLRTVSGYHTFTSGATATSATSNFFTLPSCAGVPSGTPGSIPTAQIPFLYDSTNNRLYAYNGAWRSVTLS